MTQEEKAERYDEALEKTKEIIEYYKERNRDDASIEDLEIIFPELKESEDERIRKEITGILRNAYWTSNRYRFIELVDWLEKQGELINSLSKGLDNAHERIDELIQKNNSLTEQLEWWVHR